MRLLYFSHLKSVTGCEAESVAIAGQIGLAELWAILESRHPALKSYRETVRLARNCEYVSAADLFTDSDEVALIPPVSGG